MLLTRLKQYIKSRNERGRLLHVYSFGVQILKLKTSILNYVGKSINLISLSYHTWIKKYATLETDPLLYNTRFLVFIKDGADKRLVIKVPRRDTRNGRILLRRLRDPRETHNYRKMLKSTHTWGLLSNHIADVVNVYNTGGYSMEYIDGYNLGTLFTNLLNNQMHIPHELLPDIALAVDEFLNNLNKYLDSIPDGAFFLEGDWGLYNLLYDKLGNRVVNVDLEGFYVHRQESRANNVELLLMQLHQLRDIIQLHVSTNAEAEDLKKALAIIGYAKDSSIPYATRLYAPGYYSLWLRDHYLRGQRECKKILSRLSTSGIDFKDKVVLDIGCGTGGMLHALAGVVSTGVGIDSRARYINVANAVRQINNYSDIGFFVFDFRNDDLDLIGNFILGGGVKLMSVFYFRPAMSSRIWSK